MCNMLCWIGSSVFLILTCWLFLIVLRYCLQKGYVFLRNCIISIWVYCIVIHWWLVLGDIHLVGQTVVLLAESSPSSTQQAPTETSQASSTGIACWNSCTKYILCITNTYNRGWSVIYFLKLKQGLNFFFRLLNLYAALIIHHLIVNDSLFTSYASQIQFAWQSLCRLEGIQIIQIFFSATCNWTVQAQGTHNNQYTTGNKISNE